MTQRSGYAIVGDVRAKELKTRLALGVFLGGRQHLLKRLVFGVGVDHQRVRLAGHARHEL